MSVNATGYYAASPTATTIAPQPSSIAAPTPVSVSVPALPTPAAPTPGVASTPYYQGQAPSTVTDQWVPTSFSDPYLAGLRTSGAAFAAAKGAKAVAVMSRWNSLLSARTVAARGANAAARTAGRKIGTMAKMTKQMQAAKTIDAKAQLTSDTHVGIGGAIGHSFFSIGNIFRSLWSSALFAVPVSVITDYLDYRSGKTNAQQRNAYMVADSIGYTATGAASSLLGGAIGSTFLGPGFGTLIGIGAGFGLGWIYEKFIRPTFGTMVENAMYQQPGAAPVAVAPTTVTPTPAPAPLPTPTTVAPPVPTATPVTPPPVTTVPVNNLPV